ncbi:MAG: dNTP triphosphohydrolase [Firmicutes bacterium]|nr:dNTP triphosphohydrolase [Bacillota bacterium]
MPETTLKVLRTPARPPWTDRRYPEAGEDPRSPFQRDRDRILHAAAFERLQHKTQVFIVSEGDYFRTRLTHSLEVAQIARGLAGWLGLDTDLAEAIALAHDLGHTPFGHAGEETLNRVLQDHGVEEGWNSNTHSLVVVDELEVAYPDHPGLNLTFATRQGIARHQSPFDRPAPAFDRYPQPTPEAQVVNLADMIAYAGHDVEDAVAAGLLDPAALPPDSPWQVAWRRAQEEWETAAPARRPAGSRTLLLARRARRHLIDQAVRAAYAYSLQRARAAGITTHAAAVAADAPVVALPPEEAAAFEALVRHLTGAVYGSALVARQNYKGETVLERLFDILATRPKLLPPSVQARMEACPQEADRLREVAYYLASLTDRGAFDLYAELTDPRERAMGHRREP